MSTGRPRRSLRARKLRRKGVTDLEFSVCNRCHRGARRFQFRLRGYIVPASRCHSQGRKFLKFHSLARPGHSQCSAERQSTGNTGAEGRSQRQNAAAGNERRRGNDKVRAGTECINNRSEIEISQYAPRQPRHEESYLLHDEKTHGRKSKQTKPNVEIQMSNAA